MYQSSDRLKTSVVIIGAGPTGLSMAAQLLRFGIDFIILEKNAGTTPLSKAVVVQARTLEIFHELGLAEEAISRGRVTTAINLLYRGKMKLRLDIAGLGGGQSSYPFALSLEQSKTEKLLVEYLAKNNIAIEWNALFSRFEQDDKTVTVFYKDINGIERQIDAEYLVGCDGASSLIRHEAGRTFVGDTVPKIFYVADVALKSTVITDNELYMFMIKKGFILFFPMEGAGHYRIVGILPGADPDTHFEFADIEQDIRRQVMVSLEFEKLQWFSSYKVHSRKADHFMNGRVCIAGDAAHIHTPAGGQGMNTGIQDAYNLAWKMAGVIKGKWKKNILETYDIERSENAANLLKTTDRIFDMMAGATGFLNFFRLNIFPAAARLLIRSRVVKKRVFPLLSQTGIAYPHSALTVQSSVGKVKAGDRMPYFVLANGVNIFDRITKPVFKLLFLGVEDENTFSGFENLKIDIERIAISEIPAFLFGNNTGFYILVRPDNHISYIGKDLNAGLKLLRNIMN